MDEIFDHIAETKIFNFDENSCNGIVGPILRTAPQYVDGLWRSASESFVPGLTYEGYEICSPYDAFVRDVRSAPSRTYETSRSDVIMAKYHFRFNGEPLPPRYLELPFTDDAGGIFLRGKPYYIFPVLSDRGPSVDGKSIFVPLTKNKTMYYRFYYNVAVNGSANRTRAIPVVWANALPKSQLSKNTAKDSSCKASKYRSTLSHYLLCKYGLTKTLEKFGKFTPTFGTKETVNEKIFPVEDYIIYSSTKIMPATAAQGSYVPTKLKIAVPRSKVTDFVEALIGGVFYLADTFPDQIPPDALDDIDLWRDMLGDILRNEAHVGQTREFIDRHMASIDSYVDATARKMLLDGGMEVDDIYDLYHQLMNTFTKRVIETDPTDLYNKRLSVLYYVLFDINGSIFNFNWNLDAKRLSRSKQRELNSKDVTEELNRIQLQRIKKLNVGHGECSSVSIPGDSKLMRVTSCLIQQTTATHGSNDNKDNMHDPSKFLSAGLAEICNPNNQPKSDATGRSRLSSFVKVSKSGELFHNPELDHILKPTQELVKRR